MSVITYFCCVSLTYIPLLATAKWLLAPDVTIHLPFPLDWNIAFTFLISFPTLVFMLISDEYVLKRALTKIWNSGVIDGNPSDLNTLMQQWTARFKSVNAYSYLLGITFGAILSWITLRVYIVSKAGFWASPSGEMSLTAYIYLYCIALLYMLIAIFVTRSIFFALLLRDLVLKAEIHTFPFHPDRCGGLQPVGRIGLRNQYTLTVLGLNIVILGYITFHYLSRSGAELYMVVVSILVYAVLGPIVFLGPLLPFRAGMRKTRAILMAELADRLRIDFAAIRKRLQDGSISTADVECLERLRKIGAMIQELPVWPFDAKTLRTFGSAYVIPIALPIAGKALEAALSLLGWKL